MKKVWVSLKKLQFNATCDDTGKMSQLMTELRAHIQQFTRLNRAPGTTWTDATKRRAPHKPLLLLTVLDLVHRGVITSPFIGGNRTCHW